MDEPPFFSMAFPRFLNLSKRRYGGVRKKQGLPPFFIIHFWGFSEINQRFFWGFLHVQSWTPPWKGSISKGSSMFHDAIPISRTLIKGLRRERRRARFMGGVMDIVMWRSLKSEPFIIIYSKNDQQSNQNLWSQAPRSSSNVNPDPIHH